MKSGEKVKMNFDERIDLLAKGKKKGLKMKDYSAHLNVTVSWISQFFSGKANMTNTMQNDLVSFIDTYKVV
ncbi:hypothetical protein [Lysinibacillus fusiformis]|uniref:hypothetical protein n=1 Tax=Lysinibacillus fusiformis TaxID=28031 RepID=UPI00046A3CA1|nr:hypothetical protein [Lysinibacillus fusiformis]